MGGTAILGVGLSTLSPGFKDATLAFLNQNLGLGFSEVPLWAAGVCILLGVLLLLLAFFGPARVAQTVAHLAGTSRPPGIVVAIKEVGFAPVVRGVTLEELPPRLAGREIQHLVVDISQELSANPPHLDAALAKQLRLPDQVATLRGAQADVELAFCGIVQAPFQLLAGYQHSTWVDAQALEWDRHARRWQALQAGSGPDLQPVSRIETLGQGVDAAIAVEISFNISTHDIVESVPGLSEIVRIGLAEPRLDCVTHEGQVTLLAAQFRGTLDRLHGCLPAGARVHVFVAAPMSVGFGLGRMVSRTLHPIVIAYGYDRNAQPPYRWGLGINTPAGAQQVVWN